MARRGKRYNQMAATFDKYLSYPPPEAIRMVRAMAAARFDETVEAVMKLGIDPRRADQLVRGTVVLPHGTGRSVRVAVFAGGDKQLEAEEAGAEVVGGQDLVDMLSSGGEIAFDVAIATPDMMPRVGRLGRLLGPRGLMPNPKAGTITRDVAKTVREFKGGKIEYRNDRYGNIAAPIGKVSFDDAMLYENLSALVGEIVRVKPPAAKGTYLRNLSLSSTMGPGVKVDASRLDRLVRR
ncbi:MAG: 50S ribosomal protein L1 [bacterium]|nr:50S ribosomal protein L1 [bacterium]MDE0289010.1 50S ribosomal protein L1 [bacterium]MDE0438122.1 50S ribosomal protein L1 [bacterium]